MSSPLAPAYFPPLKQTNKDDCHWLGHAGQFSVHRLAGFLMDNATCEGEVDLEEYTSSVLDVISKYADDVPTTSTVPIYPNQKTWSDTGAGDLSGDTSAGRMVGREMPTGIVRANGGILAPISTSVCGKALSGSQTTTPNRPRFLQLGLHPFQGPQKPHTSQIAQCSQQRNLTRLLRAPTTYQGR